jgi:DNA replication protein DnaC
MERLNEIMGRAIPRRPANPIQPAQPHQGQDPASQSSQTEPVSPPIVRRGSPNQASQPLPPHASNSRDSTYPYGNDGYDPRSRPDQQYYNSHSRHNQRTYREETSHSRSNGSDSYIQSHAEQDEPGAQTFTRDPYGHRGNTHDNNAIIYTPSAQYPPQQPQRYTGSQPKQEPYFHHADVNNYIVQPESDVLNEEEMEDEEELYMGYGDWEEDNNQTLVYRRSDLEAHSPNRQSGEIYEATPGYVEQSIASERSTRNFRDTGNDAGDNLHLPSPYNAKQQTRQLRSTQPPQNYPGQQAVPYPPQQTTSTAQGLPMQPARPGRQEYIQQPIQPPHPAIHEQEAPYRQRTTQPLDPQTMTGLNRSREYASPLNRARMRPIEANQQMQPEHEEVQTPQTPHTPPPQHYPAQPARQARQAPKPASNPAKPIIEWDNQPFVTGKVVCSRCRGAGYLRANVPFGHPNFGKAIACECKEAERKEKRRQQLRAMSNLDAFRQQTMSTFNTRIPGVQEAFQIAKDFAEEPAGWLVFIGPNGCGKTHLAAAIANQTLDNGAVVLFEAVPDLLDHLRAAFAPTATEVYDQLFSKMREAELLILDDLGAQQSSPWANEKLFQLLNYRYNMGMPTVITANPKGIQGVDERIRSRLGDVALVRTINMDRAQDYRPRNPRRY